MKAHIAATDAMLDEAKMAMGELALVVAGLLQKANGAYARSLEIRNSELKVPKLPGAEAPDRVTGEGKMG